jgi:hypothetical protein
MKLNEAKLKYEELFISYLYRIRAGHECIEKKAAEILIFHTGDNFFPIAGTNLDVLPDGSIQYDRVFKNKEGIEELKTQKAGLQRFLTQLFKDIGKPQNQNIIDALSRRLKSYADSKGVEIKLVVGSAIPWCYLDDNTIESGSLGRSCMRTSDKQEYLELYEINPESVALLVVVSNGLVVARRLIWHTDNDIITYDTIYTASPGYESMIEEVSQFAANRGDILTPSEWTKSVMTEEDLENLEHWEQYLDARWDKPRSEDITIYNIPKYMPYLDTYYDVTVDRETITLYNGHSGEYIARSQEGYISRTCQNCGGNGSIDCDDCNGNGEVDCPECGGDDNCPSCEGSGESEEKDEDGNLISCDSCNGFGTGNCPNCSAGTIRCNNCSGEGLFWCEYCDEDHNENFYIGDLL